MAIDLTGKVLVVTGASSGIGAATAVAAGRAGMRVVLAARRVEMLESVAAKVREVGGEAEVVACDLADDAQIGALFEMAVERFGRVDVLYANAGYGFMQRGDDTDVDDDEARMWRVNYFACVRCCRAAAKIMRTQQSGHIILCSSIVGRIGLPYYATYAATKAAQHAFAASLGPELRPAGIRVSTVYPVGTKTEFFDVSAAHRGDSDGGANTPDMLTQTAEHVARKIVRCMRKPKPEVWPSFVGRLGTVMLTMFPRLFGWAMKSHTTDCRRTLRAGDQSSENPSGSDGPK